MDAEFQRRVRERTMTLLAGEIEPDAETRADAWVTAEKQVREECAAKGLLGVLPEDVTREICAQRKREELGVLPPCGSHAGASPPTQALHLSRRRRAVRHSHLDPRQLARDAIREAITVFLRTT